MRAQAGTPRGSSGLAAVRPCSGEPQAEHSSPDHTLQGGDSVTRICVLATKSVWARHRATVKCFYRRKSYKMAYNTLNEYGIIN